MARIDDRNLVQYEYSDASRLAARFAPLRELQTSYDIDWQIVQSLYRRRAQKILEVGCGEAKLGRMLQYWLGADLTAVDQSSHMVDLARQQGINALVADAQDLPFPDRTFDGVVASFMLYHLPDLNRGLHEMARVMSPDGVLVATTMGDMLPDVWSMVPDDGSTPELSFNQDNGHDLLSRHFKQVDQRRFLGTAVFPDRDAVLRYMRGTITRQHLARDLPSFDGSLEATTDVTLFVASQPR